MQTPATAALDAADVEYRCFTYDHDPTTGGWGAEAAAALNLDPAAVFKTLMVDVDGEVCVAIVPVSGQLDLKALARLAGGRKATLCDPARAQRLTGYVIGGISPLGQRGSHRTFIDETVILFDEVFVSGGRRGFDIGLDPDALVEVSGASLGDLGR